MAQSNNVPLVYNSVVNDVINNVREAFLDESVDEQALQELKQLWESKLRQSKAVEGLQPEQEHMVSVYAQQQVQMQQQQQQQRQQQRQQQQAIQVQAASVPQASQAVQLPLYNPATGTVDLSGAAQAATIALPAGIYPQQVAALGGGTIIQAQGGAQYIIQAAPGQVIQASQPATSAAAQQPGHGMIQIDGANDSSSDEEEEANEEDDDDDQEDENAEAEDQQEEEEPLCSDDDVSDEDVEAASDLENVIVCQFDKIHRSKNRWKFHLKDGIMNLNGRDYVFQKATGDAEW